MSSKQLTKNDSRVLAKVFDPESAPAHTEILVNPDLPADSQIQDRELHSLLRAREREAIAIIERYEMSEVQRDDKSNAYKSALATLDNLIEEHPNYASARNNRAQLRRWRFGDRRALCRPSGEAGPVLTTVGTDTVRDLRAAIALASPERPQDAVSPEQGRLLAQSYTQLAAVFHAACKDLDTAAVMEIISPDFSGWNKSRFEDEASKLFYLGGLYGNEVAKALAVHTNPHAKLCGSIVKEAMRKELMGLS